MQVALLACQSVFTNDLDVYGYELFLQREVATELNSQNALDTLLDTVAEHGIDRIVGNAAIVFNCTGVKDFSFLQQQMPSYRTYLEIAVSDIASDIQLQRIEKLRKQRFSIIIRDNDMQYDWNEFNGLVDVIRIDVNCVEQQALIQAKENYGHHYKFILDHVNNYDILNSYQTHGIDYFQGQFLSSPNIIKSQDVPVHSLVVLRLINKLNVPTVTAGQVEVVLSQDPRLTYRLLRLINSAAYNLPRKITSLKEAIIYLGLQQIKRWVTVLSFASIKDKPIELMRVTLTRAKMCEVIAKALDVVEPGSYFLVGLLSTLDALLDDEMENIVNSLELDVKLIVALLNHEGEIGAVLQQVIAYEQGDWSSDKYALLTGENFQQAYFEAVNWARSSCNSIYC